MSITFTWNNPNTAEYLPEETRIYRSESPFEDIELPEALVILPGAAVSYIDETAVDGTTYFYRVSFKLGIREMISRLVEIKAPTSPDIFESIILVSPYPYSRSSPNDWSDVCSVVSDFENGVYPLAIGKNGKAGYRGVLSYKSEESIAVRLAAMIAIQKFKRDVWLTETITILAPTAITTFGDTGNTYGWRAAQQSGIPAGSILTWKEAFDIIGRISASMDICMNVINALKADICISFTASRGRPPSDYRFADGLAVLMDYVYALGSFQGFKNPFLGNGEFIPPGVYLGTSADYGGNVDGMGILRLVRAAWINYPEIMNTMTVWDQGGSLTYKTAALAVVDYLSTLANHRDNSDHLQSLTVPSHATNNGTAEYSARYRALNGSVNLYADMFAITGCSSGDSTNNGANPTGVFLTETPNGKDFFAEIANANSGSRIIFAFGMLWNKVSAHSEEYTNGLSEVDPLESQVVLRVIPHLGMVDQSARGTPLTVLGGAYDHSKHLSAGNVSPGFANPALAVRGSDTENIGTIKTDLNMMEYILNGTSFCIEMYLSHAWNTAAPLLSADYSLFELGSYLSGARYYGVDINPQAGSLRSHQHTSHAAARTYSVILPTFGYFATSETAFSLNGGSRYYQHVALQYDAIANMFEMFVNGVMTDRWQPFTPTGGLNIPLCFLGCVYSAADQTSQYQYTAAGKFNSELLIHEIVVTLAKRYNYACFIGKNPFARKRFSV